MTSTIRIPVATAIAIGAMIASPAMAEDNVQLGTGIDYSSGDYGDTQNTKMLAVPFSVKVTTGNVFLRASIPYLHIKGPGSVVGGDGGAIPGGPSGPVTSNDGIGDLSLSAGYTLPVSDATSLDFIGRVKVPTASESKNLGTGTTDWTAEAAINQMVGPVMLTARGGRRFNGSSVRFLLRDVWQAGAGAYYQTGPLTLGLDYDWREASLPTASDRSEMTASATFRISPQVRLQGYGYTGFSDGSPDIGGGMQILYRFGL